MWIDREGSYRLYPNYVETTPTRHEVFGWSRGALVFPVGEEVRVRSLSHEMQSRNRNQNAVLFQVLQPDNVSRPDVC